MSKKEEEKHNLPVSEDTESSDTDLSSPTVEEESDIENDRDAERNANDDWYEQQEFVADPKQSYIRVDKFLMDRMSNRSRSKVQNAIRAGSVKVDNQDVKPNYKVKPGNLVSIVLPKSQEEGSGIKPQNIPLDIIHEDEEILIINKPARMAVHPGVGIPNGTVVNAVAWHLRGQEDDLPVKLGNDADRAGIVHRIDKDTTGLMVVAKKEFAMVYMANQFFNHTIERKYWALVWGDVEKDSGTIIGNIGRNPNDRKLFMVFPEGEEGKHAVTHYRVLERYYYVTLIECQLETGRTHQIRVHMKYIGHTLFGDPRYGGNHVLKGTLYSKYKQFAEGLLQICPRQALHAKVLGFAHPRTGKHVHFESDLPQDMQTVLNKWRDYVQSRKELL